MKSAELRVASYPVGVVGLEHFAVVKVDVPDDVDGLADGEVLVRNTWTSRRSRSAAPPASVGARRLLPGLPARAPMDGILTIGEVVASRAAGIDTGDTVWHSLGWREYAVVRASDEAMNGIGTLRRLDPDGPGRSGSSVRSGAMGLTAYAGLAVAGALGGGEVVWVSAGAGAVGSLVAQIARCSGTT